MPYPIRDIDGIDVDTAKRLKSFGLRTTASLLETLKDARGRKHFSEKSGYDEQTLLEWANIADQMRVKGLGKDYVPLVREAGVRTVRELKYRNANRLARAIADANKGRKRPVRFLPSEKAVQRWIDEAKALEIKISY
jgi:hypothetical protein